MHQKRGSWKEPITCLHCTWVFSCEHLDPDMLGCLKGQGPRDEAGSSANPKQASWGESMAGREHYLVRESLFPRHCLLCLRPPGSPSCKQNTLQISIPLTWLERSLPAVKVPQQERLLFCCPIFHCHNPINWCVCLFYKAPSYHKPSRYVGCRKLRN